MADKEMEAGITVEWIETDEEPFRPEKTTEIFAKLEPVEAAQTTFFPPTYTDFYNSSVLPPAIGYKKLPEFESVKRELIINLETTTANPWEGRIICIGILDPNALAPMAVNFIQDTELATLEEFLTFFEQSPYETLVGYNVSFDYRFLYAVLQKYRRESRKLLEMNLYDLMQQQKQVKHEYVFGFNKPGKLEEWATYLFGSQPYAPQKQLFKWYEQGNTEEIVNFNSDKLAKSYGLWVLNKVVEGSIPGAEVLARPSTQTLETGTVSADLHQENPSDTIPITCPSCLQTQSMPKTAKVVNCVVCGEPIAHP